MKKQAIWTEGINKNINKSLNHDEYCDVLIIGGGMAGLSTALNLKDENVKTILIDKDKCAYGVTSHTTGKLTYLQGGIYPKIENTFDFVVAKRYLDSQKDAIKIVKENIQKYNIDCDFQEVDSYIFSVKDDKELTKERDFFLRANIEYRNQKKLPLKFPCTDALYVPDTAVFHPLKYLMKIKNIIENSNIKIYENTIALDLDIEEDRYIIKTPNGDIKALKVIVCTHYPFFVIPGLIPLKLHLEKAYALASKTEETKNFSAINIDNVVYSIRYYQGYMIFGGYSHALGDKLDFEKEEDRLLNFCNSHFKEKINYVWQTHDVMTHDHLPLIGKLNHKHPNLLIATGFNKWGMTNGTIAGQILADITMNRPNKYSSLFNPERPFNMIKASNFIINNLKMAKVFIEAKLNKNRPFYKNAFITSIDGKTCGVYIDKDKTRHIVSNICPHLKCSLIFNNSAKTWDCPCHGSRFDIDGNQIEGPSVHSIKIDNKN